jgi:hypothetical protein
VLAVGLTAATTEVGDIDGAPLGVLAAGLTAVTTEDVGVTSDPPGGGGLAQSSRCLRRATDPTHNYMPWAIQCSNSRGGEQGVGQRCLPSRPPATNPKASGERSTHA